MFVPRGLKLFPSASIKLYVFCVIKGHMGLNLSKQDFGRQDIVVLVRIVSLLLTLTRKLTAYLLSLSFTHFIFQFCDSHSESEM